jgi:hypothetical protein
MSADSPVDDWRYKAGQAAGILGATIDSPEVQEQVNKNLKGLGRGVKRAITDIPDEVVEVAKGLASAASKAVDPETYIEMADAIAMLYKCRQNPCCWKKLMESLGEMPSATLEAAARKLKDLGNLKQEEVFEMLGKEWGRAVMMGAAAEAEGAFNAARADGLAFKGTSKPWLEGATPNSTYTHIDPKTGKALQNAVYNSEGKVVGHVDFKNHGNGATSGHGHAFPEPGSPSSGHGPTKPHIPNTEIPAGWDKLPEGVEPATPIGQ